MIKLMSMVMSLELGQAATVTDVDGNSISIEDTMLKIYEMGPDDFSTSWYTLDDRVMGGASYSYINYESTTSTGFPTGYGKFYGTASSVGGGFSLISNHDMGPESGRSGDDNKRLEMYEYPKLYDLSEYDGLMINVASQDPRTYKVLLTDTTWRWPSFIYWEGLFETKGNFEVEQIYIPFSNFYPTFGGFSMWPYRWIIPFGGLNTGALNTIGYQYSVFEYISWWFGYIVAT